MVMFMLFFIMCIVISMHTTINNHINTLKNDKMTMQEINEEEQEKALAKKVE